MKNVSNFGAKSISVWTWKNNDEIWCNYYKKKGHTEETCWKLNENQHSIRCMWLLYNIYVKGEQSRENSGFQVQCQLT